MLNTILSKGIEKLENLEDKTQLHLTKKNIRRENKNILIDIELTICNDNFENNAYSDIRLCFNSGDKETYIKLIEFREVPKVILPNSNDKISIYENLKIDEFPIGYKEIIASGSCYLKLFSDKKKDYIKIKIYD